VSNYVIRSTPDLATIAEGGTVTYEVVLHTATDEADYRGVRWMIYFDSRLYEKDDQFKTRNSWIETHFQYTWEEIGEHRVVALVRWAGSSEPLYLEKKQWVHTVDAVMGTKWKTLRGNELPDPLKELHALRRVLGAYVAGETYARSKGWSVDDVGTMHSTYEEGVRKQEHNKKIREYKKKKQTIVDYETALEKLVDISKASWSLAVPYGHWRFYSIRALYLDRSSGSTAELRVCVAIGEGPLTEPRPAYTDYYVTIIDWTNPLEKKYSRTFSAFHQNKETALNEALKEWDKKNPYPSGIIKYEIPEEVVGRLITGKFEVGERSLWDKIADFLDWAAAAAVILLVVATLINPVVGAQYAAVLISAAAATSSTAAAIRIVRRRQTDDDNLLADAFDTLTIVTSVFSAVWVRGASVAVAEGRLGLKSGKYVLMAQFTTDSVQGILVGVEGWKDYNDIMDDRSLTPEERAEKLLNLFKRLGLAATMTYFNLKSTHADLKGLHAMEDLKAVDRMVDLDGELKIASHTDQGAANTVVNSKPGRATSFKPAKPPKARGMRPRDDIVFKEVAAEGKVILVRNSNEHAVEYIGKKGYKAKPMKMKAKTRTQGKNAGLAAADPNDKRLVDMLKSDKKTYKQFVEEMDSRGYGVASKEDGFVIFNKETGEKYYSDYDLHGVYDINTGKSAYSSSFKDELNKKFGDEVVQHGPHDEWPDRNKKEAGINRGPQPPVTAYLPDGTTVHLETIDDMKKFYKELNINWEKIYPEAAYRVPVGAVTGSSDDEK
jgi:hypothetical protein